MNSVSVSTVVTYIHYMYNSYISHAISSLSIQDCLNVFIITIVAVFTIKWIVLPVNWVEDLADVGYDDLAAGKKSSNKKIALVREIQQRKKVGDIPPVYPNGWYALLESSALRVAQVRYVSALDENFAVIRNDSGEVSVLDAYCPHLGANIAIGGVVRNNCIECPFHGWRFNVQNGECTSIPYTDKVPDTAKMKRWTSREVNGFIFVWYHIDGVEPTWHLESNPSINNRSWMYRGRNEFRINCHIQEIPENGCDVAHLASIHSLPMLNGSKQLIQPAAEDITLITCLLSNLFKHTWSAQWTRDPRATHKAHIALVHDFKVFNKLSVMHLNVTVQQIGPSYVELLLNHSLGPMLIVQAILPEGPLLQKVVHHIYCPWYLSVMASCALIGETIMFKRDMVVWNHKTYLERPFLVKGDGNIMQYRRWYSQFFSKSSKRFSFQNNDRLDW